MLAFLFMIPWFALFLVCPGYTVFAFSSFSVDSPFQLIVHGHRDA